jgi:hypothetical protein
MGFILSWFLFISISGFVLWIIFGIVIGIMNAKERMSDMRKNLKNIADPDNDFWSGGNKKIGD